MKKVGLILTRDVSKRYYDDSNIPSVLEGIDLEIDEGELVVILGRSGSGKSTLLNLLGAMDAPTSGEIWIDGQRIDALSELDRTRFRRRHLGFVFQAFNLIPTLTVSENLALPLALNGLAEASPSPETTDIVESQLDALGLSGKAGAYPDELSGGEQQRVAVARALIHRPALVIADEPTGNLDLETGRQVLELLDRMTRESGRTLVMATHSREVVGMADRVFTIREGRMVPSEVP